MGRSGTDGGGRGQGRSGTAVGDRRNVSPHACVAGIVYPVLHRASNMPRGKTGVRIFSASPVGFQRFVSTVRTEVSFTDRSVDRSLLPEEVIYAAELARAPAPCCRNRRLGFLGAFNAPLHFRAQLDRNCQRFGRFRGVRLVRRIRIPERRRIIGEFFRLAQNRLQA